MYIHPITAFAVLLRGALTARIKSMSENINGTLEIQFEKIVTRRDEFGSAGQRL